MVTPTVVSVVALDGYDEHALLALAAGAATGLEASVGAAIVRSARGHEVEVGFIDRVEHAAGAGVVARVGPHTVVVGTAALFTSLGLSVDRLGEWPERLRERGQQVLLVAVDGRTAGFLGVANADL